MNRAILSTFLLVLMGLGVFGLSINNVHAGDDCYDFCDSRDADELQQLGGGIICCYKDGLGNIVQVDGFCEEEFPEPKWHCLNWVTLSVRFAIAVDSSEPIVDGQCRFTQLPLTISYEP